VRELRAGQSVSAPQAARSAHSVVPLENPKTRLRNDLRTPQKMLGIAQNHMPPHGSRTKPPAHSFTKDYRTEVSGLPQFDGSINRITIYRRASLCYKNRTRVVFEESLLMSRVILPQTSTSLSPTNFEDFRLAAAKASTAWFDLVSIRAFDKTFCESHRHTARQCISTVTLGQYNGL